MTALLAPMFIGGLAIVVDATYWRYRVSMLQTAADMTAMALAEDVGNNILNVTVLAKNARSEAVKNGCGSGCSVSVVYPYNADTSAVKVSISDPSAARFFSFLYDTSQKSLSASSAATTSNGGSPSSSYGGNGCLLATSVDATKAGITLSGGSTIPNASCEAYSGTSSVVTGGSRANGTVSSVTTTTVQAGSYVGTPLSVQSRVIDPYASTLTIKGGIASSGACSDSGAAVDWSYKTWTISPGHWCRGWNLGSGAVLNLTPGVYYLGNNDQGYSGVFNINGGSRINATSGVTIVLIDVAAPVLTAGATINIVAPTSGSTAGLSLVTNTDSTVYNKTTNPIQFNINGGTTLAYTGVLYFPQGELSISGGTSAYNSSAPCTQIVASRITISGGSQVVGNQCQGIGVQAFGSKASWTNPTGKGGTGTGMGYRIIP